VPATQTALSADRYSLNLPSRSRLSLANSGRRRNDGASGERATTPTSSARRSTLSIVGWLSTAAGFTVVTRRRHQLAKPPSRRIMTLYHRLAISPSQRLIADAKNNIRRAPAVRTCRALSSETCRSTELARICGPLASIDRRWRAPTDRPTDLAHRHATTGRPGNELLAAGSAHREQPPTTQTQKLPAELETALTENFPWVAKRFTSPSNCLDVDDSFCLSWRPL